MRFLITETTQHFVTADSKQEALDLWLDAGPVLPEVLPEREDTRRKIEFVGVTERTVEPT